jgi:F0F1-type ATP synthase membrane subunit b/b'
MGTEIGPTFVDQLLAASAEAKDVLSELRSELAEVRRQRKALGRALNAAQEAVRKAIEQEIESEVERQVGELSIETRRAMDNATTKILKEFEGLHNLILAGNRQGNPKDGDDLRSLLKRRAGM